MPYITDMTNNNQALTQRTYQIVRLSGRGRPSHRSAPDRQHGGQAGQIILMVAVGTFLLLCFALFTINAGYQIQRRAQSQAATDMVALTGTSWMARELNLISMTNTAMAMSLAEIEMFKATLLTANTLTRYGWELKNEICHSQPESCNEASEQYANISAIVTELNDNVNTGEGIVAAQETLWDLAAQLTEAEAALALAMPPAALAAAQRIGTSNAATLAILSPYPTPPIRVSRVNALCPIMFRGRPGGYEPSADGFGPLYGVQQRPFVDLWSRSAPLYEAPAWFEALLTARAGLTCTGLEPDPLATSVHPYVMSHGWERNVQYDGIATFGPESIVAPLAPDRFQADTSLLWDDLETARKAGLVTVARAELYNPYQSDTFTPQWRARLIPVVSHTQDLDELESDPELTPPPVPTRTANEAFDSEEFELTVKDMLESMSWLITH